MRKENVVKKTFYINEDLSNLLDSEKVRTNSSISEIISTAVDRYFKSNLLEDASVLQGPLDEKVDRMNSTLNQMKKTEEALYRNLTYIAGLMNIGFIEADGVFKYNSATKSVARKKALKNYQKLKSGELTLEDYLVELDDDMKDLEKEEEREQSYEPTDSHENFVNDYVEPVKVEEPKHEEPKRSSFSDWFGN